MGRSPPCSEGRNGRGRARSGSVTSRQQARPWGPPEALGGQGGDSGPLGESPVKGTLGVGSESAGLSWKGKVFAISGIS